MTRTETDTSATRGLPAEAVDLAATHREIGAVLDEVRFDIVGSLHPLRSALDVFHTDEATRAIPSYISSAVLTLSEELIARTDSGAILGDDALGFFDAVHEAFGDAITASYPSLTLRRY